MFTAEQYRKKANEYGSLLESARSPAETIEYRELQKSYSLLAENLDWLAVNTSKTVLSSAFRVSNRVQVNGRAKRVDEETILRCLGAAVVLNWNAIPTSLQRILFEEASFTPDIQTQSLREALARFLHDHKDDAQQDGLLPEPRCGKAARVST